MARTEALDLYAFMTTMPELFGSRGEKGIEIRRSFFDGPIPHYTLYGETKIDSSSGLEVATIELKRTDYYDPSQSGNITKSWAAIEAHLLFQNGRYVGLAEGGLRFRDLPHTDLLPGTPFMYNKAFYYPSQPTSQILLLDTDNLQHLRGGYDMVDHAPTGAVVGFPPEKKQQFSEKLPPHIDLGQLLRIYANGIVTLAAIHNNPIDPLSSVHSTQ